MPRAALILILGFAAATLTAQSHQELLRAKLDESIRAVDREFDGVLGVAIQDLSSGETILHNADQVFPIASTIKILVLAELLRQADVNKIDLNDTYTLRREDIVAGDGVLQRLTVGSSVLTIRDLATLTVTSSDNTATNVLINRLGMSNINRFAEELGLKQTRLRRKMMDARAAVEGRENTSTPREMMTLLASIHRDRGSAGLLELLSLPKDSSISGKLPSSVRIANKPGSLDGVRTDAGIVFVPSRPFAIAVMTTFAADGASAEETIQEIAAAAYRYFDRLARSSEHGRALR